MHEINELHTYMYRWQMVTHSDTAAQQNDAIKSYLPETSVSTANPTRTQAASIYNIRDIRFIRLLDNV